MSVGTTGLQFYQNEDVEPGFTVTDPTITDITGWAIEFVIKASAADDDPALQTAAGVISGGPPTLDFTVPFQIDVALAPGAYVYSIRRTDAGFEWQLAHGSFTIVDSAGVDLP